MARILIAEDDAALGPLLEYNIASEGHDPLLVTSGDEALLSVREAPPDLVVLDWMMPGTPGIEVCRQMRAGAETAQVPILILTARGEEGDRVRGLETGADDYVTKPFSVSELMARIKALLRRSGGAGDATLRFGDLTLDRETRRVHRGGDEVRLGPTEFRLLECLMRRPGRVFSRAQLLDIVWGREVYVEERTVDVHVGRLRKALGDGPDPIRTVRAAGYALDETYAG